MNDVHAARPRVAALPLKLPGVPAPYIGSRALFPHLGARAFLAHAAISPASLALTRAVSEHLEMVADLGVGSFPIYQAQRERLRERLAGLLGVPPSTIALTPGCTRSIADVALALPWQTGDSLLTYRGEFPANVIPFQLAADRFGGTVQFLDLPCSTDPDFAERVGAELRDALLKSSRVLAVAVSAVQFQSGVRLPLARMSHICREFGARLLVDGIQGCGVIPLDLVALGVDAFFSGTHKWLLGLEGSGVSYVSPQLMAELRPLTAGWLSFPDAEAFLFQGPGHLSYARELYMDSRVFEGSTTNALGFVALEAGVEIIAALTPAAIYAHVQSYHDALEPELVRRGFRSLRATESESRSTLLSLEVPVGISAPKLAGLLRERGIVVSIPDGILRIAPHFSNELAEVVDVLACLDEVLPLAHGS